MCNFLFDKLVYAIQTHKTYDQTSLKACLRIRWIDIECTLASRPAPLILRSFAGSALECALQQKKKNWKTNIYIQNQLTQ